MFLLVTMPTKEEEPMVHEFGEPQKCDTLILRLNTVPLTYESQVKLWSDIILGCK